MCVCVYGYVLVVLYVVYNTCEEGGGGGGKGGIGHVFEEVY